MAGHLLGVLESPGVFQVDRDAGPPPGVTSDRGEKTSRLGPLSNSRPGVVPVKSSSGDYPVATELTLWNMGCPFWRPLATMYSFRIFSSR
jgi:hypothetical protein